MDTIHTICFFFFLLYIKLDDDKLNASEREKSTFIFRNHLRIIIRTLIKWQLLEMVEKR